MDQQARAPNADERVISLRETNAEERQGLALFGYVTGKTSGYTPAPKQISTSKDKSKSLAAMFPTNVQQSNGSTPPGSHLSPPPVQQANGAAPPSQMTSPSVAYASPSPASYASPPLATYESYVNPTPASHVSSPPAPSQFPKVGAHVGQAQRLSSSSVSSASPTILVMLEAVVDGCGYRLHCQQEKPLRLLVGREVQAAEQWEKLVPCEASRSSISREHFEIRESADSPSGYILANLSASGTVVNGQMTYKESPVDTGDSITIGLDQSPAAILAAKNPLASRRPALQMYFIAQTDGWQGHSVCAALECIHVAGRSQNQIAQLPKAARSLQGNGAAGKKAALLRVGRAMQLQSWWENLFQDDRLVNGISREHFQIRIDDAGRPTLHNMSSVGTVVNNDHLIQQQSRPLSSEDTIAVLNKSDNGKLVTFRFMALDVATGRALFEPRKETPFQTSASKVAFAAVQGLAGDNMIGCVSASPPVDQANQAKPPPSPAEQPHLWKAAQSIGTEMSFGQVPAVSRTAVPAQVPPQAPRVVRSNEAPAQNQSLNEMLIEAEALGTVEGESSWRLQCTSAYNQDPAHLAQVASETKHHLIPAVGCSKIKIGRMAQPADFWAKLMPLDWAKNTISRECFELAYETSDERGLIFAFTNLSNGGTLVNRKRVHSTAKVRVGDTFGVGGVQPPAGQTELLPVLEFAIVCADSTNPSPWLASKSPRGSSISQSSQRLRSPSPNAGLSSQRARSPSPNSGAIQQFTTQLPREDPTSQDSIGFGVRRRRTPSPSSRCVVPPFNAAAPRQTAFSQLIAQASSSATTSPRQSPPQPIAPLSGVPPSPRQSPSLPVAPLSGVPPSPRQSPSQPVAPLSGVPPSPRQSPSQPVAPLSGVLSQTPLLSRNFADDHGNPTSQIVGPLTGPLSQAPLLSRQQLDSPSCSSQNSASRRHCQLAEEFLAGPSSPALECREPLPIDDSFGQWPSEQSTGRTSDASQLGRGSDTSQGRKFASAQTTADTSAFQASGQSQNGEKPFASLRPSSQSQFSNLLDVTADDESLPRLSMMGVVRGPPVHEPQAVNADPKPQEDQQLVYALCPPISSFGGLQDNTQNFGSMPSVGELALTKMEENESQMWMLGSSMDTTERAFDCGQLSCGEARDALAQLETKLVRLQGDVDSVVLSGMTSRSSDEARQLQAELIQKAEAFQNRLQSLFLRLQGT